MFCDSAFFEYQALYHVHLRSIRLFFSCAITSFCLMLAGCGSSVSTVLPPQTTLPSSGDQASSASNNTALPTSSQGAPEQTTSPSQEQLTENSNTASNVGAFPYSSCGQTPMDSGTATVYASNFTTCTEAMPIARMYIVHLIKGPIDNINNWTCGPSQLPGFFAQCVNRQKSFVLRQDS